jgi:hypothetical protein
MCLLLASRAFTISSLNFLFLASIPKAITSNLGNVLRYSSSVCSGTFMVARVGSVRANLSFACLGAGLVSELRENEAHTVAYNLRWVLHGRLHFPLSDAILRINLSFLNSF